MRLASLVGAASVLATASVQAETVNLQHTANGNGRMIRASINSLNKDVFAGRLMHTVQRNGGGTYSMASFSTDLLQACSSSSTPYNTSSVALLSGNAGVTNLGMGKMQAVYDIFAAAANRQFTLGHDYATAFQVALWEIVYDYNPNAQNQGLNIASGVFRATQTNGALLSQSIRDKVGFLLNAVVTTNANGTNVMGYRSGGYGDQVTQILPLPTGAWLGMAGLGLVAVARRRLARN